MDHHITYYFFPVRLAVWINPCLLGCHDILIIYSLGFRLVWMRHRLRLYRSELSKNTSAWSLKDVWHSKQAKMVKFTCMTLISCPTFLLMVSKFPIWSFVRFNPGPYGEFQNIADINNVQVFGENRADQRLLSWQGKLLTQYCKILYNTCIIFLENWPISIL